jgi:hypothetical protein
MTCCSVPSLIQTGIAVTAATIVFAESVLLHAPHVIRIVTNKDMGRREMPHPIDASANPTLKGAHAG